MTKQGHDALRWSTGHIAPGDRFAYWREALSVNLIGMTPEAAREDRAGFEGNITCIPVGDTGVLQLDMKISQLRMERAVADIRAMPGNGIFLFRASSPDMNFLFDDRDNFAPQVGITVIGGLDRPRRSIITQPDRYRCEVLRIPSSAFAGHADELALLDPREVDLSSGVSSLLHGFFNSFLRELPRLSSLERETALTTLTNLVTLSLHRERAHHEPVREAVRTARLRMVQDYIVRHAPDPGLSPASVARALRMSVRQIHALFEPSETTFSRYLLSERIRRAVQILTSNRATTVSDIAYRCGFESLPTFYRAFRGATGATPRNMRTPHQP